MELKIYNIKGEDTGKTIVVSDSLFQTEPNDHVMWLNVKQFLADQRQGTHKSKERSEVSGSTRKLKRQKGTGGARSGDINSPVMIGGGRAFGPRPRDYRFKLNRKVKVLARLSALSYKAKDEQIKVVEDFSFETPKTKQMVQVLDALQLKDKKSLFILQPGKENFVSLSARNLKNVRVMSAHTLNTYEILHANTLVFSESALKTLDAMHANA
ncbi:MAG: 50S ribosomal protein L4 [Bacteroidales bacterium]|nr:50S ribosomal protein L4 [Candidatus Scybalousia scybalohippi]MCQ2326039.1 50S ribosomal protein L4 [Bacteroidales bacterium]